MNNTEESVSPRDSVVSTVSDDVKLMGQLAGVSQQVYLLVAARVAAIESENRLFRRMLAVAHAGAQLYCDDGELQDSSRRPIIDWKRNSGDTIQEKLRIRAQNALALHESGEAILKVTPNG
jgi:hypothetical protein